MEPTKINAYEKSKFSAPTLDGHTITHDIYALGSGPTIVIIQELPGIGQETLRLADKLVSAGFSVVMPHLFGPIGRTSLLGNTARVFCMRREFSLFSSNKSSPITDWLKALCKQIKNDRSVSGVGVIGMCLTGNFALSLMADDSVLASVSSQPSLPLKQPEGLHMSEPEIVTISERIDKLGPIKMLRFEGDWMCSPQKERAIDAAFNTANKVRVEKHVIPGKGHAVLTTDFVDEVGHPTHEALESTIQYLKKQLC